MSNDSIIYCYVVIARARTTRGRWGQWLSFWQSVLPINMVWIPNIRAARRCCWCRWYPWFLSGIGCRRSQRINTTAQPNPDSGSIKHLISGKEKIQEYLGHSQGIIFHPKTVNTFYLMEHVHYRTDSRLSTISTDGSYGYRLNERFSVVIHKKRPIPWLVTAVGTELLMDTETNEIMAKEVTVGSGVGNILVSNKAGYKFWLNIKSCRIGRIWDDDIARQIGIENERSRK